MKLVHITRTIKIENKIVCLSKNRGWITASSSVRQSIGNESSNIMGEKESRSQGLIRFFLGCIPCRVANVTFIGWWPRKKMRSSLLQLSQWRIDTRFALLTNWSTLESVRRPRCFRAQWNARFAVWFFDYQRRSIIAQVSAENRVKLYRRFCLLLLRLAELGSQRTFRC